MNECKTYLKIHKELVVRDCIKSDHICRALVRGACELVGPRSNGCVTRPGSGDDQSHDQWQLGGTVGHVCLVNMIVCRNIELICE